MRGGAKERYGMKVLSIGNSFSCDAQRYLHRIAKKEGVNIKAVNLSIGGCPLRTHYVNVLQDNANYGLVFNGEETGFKVSIAQALVSDDWDVVTLQQASQHSAKYETYSPYIETLAEYVRKYCPCAKIFIHQTWAYEDGSERLKNVGGYDSAEEMFSDIEAAYTKAAALIHADGIIPSGRGMLNATKFGIEKIHRDTFHASLGAGRYLVGLTWYKALTGKDITNNDFDEFDLPVSQEEREIVIKAVNAAFETENKKLFGKTFLFLGDSLTEGVRGTSSQEKRYVDVFARLTGAKVQAYGVGGTRIAYQRKPTTYKPRHDLYFASRVKDMQEEADYVVVFGGSNDLAGGDAPLGEFGDSTLETFYGALHDLFTRLKEKYPTATILAVTPLHRPEEDEPFNSVGCARPGGMEAYANAIKQVAAAFDIVVVDAYRDWNINPKIAEQREAYFSADNIHPNDNGHQYIAERLLEFMNNLQ